MPLHETPDGLPPRYETDKHPGHWHLHHIVLPSRSPGDFTPYRAPEYAEQEFGMHEPLLEFLAELFTVDHAQAIAQRGREAGL
jgi:hypothetical protein